MRSNIILFPEIEKLKTEISSLKARISELLCMRDQMLFVECKNIEMEYMLPLGDLEYKAYELNCHMLRLKRKAELIQACKTVRKRSSFPRSRISLIQNLQTIRHTSTSSSIR